MLPSLGRFPHETVDEYYPLDSPILATTTLVELEDRSDRNLRWRLDILDIARSGFTLRVNEVQARFVLVLESYKPCLKESSLVHSDEDPLISKAIFTMGLLQ